MPAPVNEGTGVFIGFFAMVIIFFWAMQTIGRISKDSFQIIAVITSTLGVATWLLWLCAWMHQWHPLLVPTWKAVAER